MREVHKIFSLSLSNFEVNKVFFSLTEVQNITREKSGKSRMTSTKIWTMPNLFDFWLSETVKIHRIIVFIKERERGRGGERRKRAVVIEFASKTEGSLTNNRWKCFVIFEKSIYSFRQLRESLINPKKERERERDKEPEALPG